MLNLMRIEEPRPGSDRTAVMLCTDGQIDRRILDEARSLVKASWKVTVVAGQPPVVGDRHDEELYPEVSIIRIDRHKTPGHRTAYPSGFKAINRLAWRTLFDYQDQLWDEAVRHPATVYVAHDLPQLLPAAMAASYHRAYLVYDAHELFPDQGFTRYNLKSLLTEVERALIPLADQVITVNQSIAELMAARYHVPVPEVILNSPALHRQLTLPVPRFDLFRQELSIPEDQFILLYQGVLARNRNLENLVEAMTFVQNPKVTLVLMGPGLAVAKDLARLARKLGLLNQRIFFRDPVSQAELLQYTASADAGIIPYASLDLNLYYVSPNKLFEFIVAGLPIIANDLPELNRFVSQLGVGLNMPMGTPTEIARAIDSFFQMDLAAYRQRAQILSPQFVWDVQGEKIVHLYQQLLTRQPRAGQLPVGPQTSKNGRQVSASRAPLATSALLTHWEVMPIASALMLAELLYRLSPDLYNMVFQSLRRRLRSISRGTP